MDLFLIDAIGPFFRGIPVERVNWSKIPFPHLLKADEARWQEIETDLRHFASQVTALGYNAVTLDDLAHLAQHPLHEPEVATSVALFREKLAGFIAILHREFGLKVFLTTDVLPMTPAVEAGISHHKDDLEIYYRDLVRGVLDDFPDIEGLVLRIGESDGHDVSDPVRTRLHLTSARETNRLLKLLLPEFESRKRTLILRTWTVGAHRIGDLIWNHGTLTATLNGIDSPNFIVSMKPGDSDFFRHLPLNPAFLKIPQRKIIELQARREYEGAGEYPAFIGWDCEKLAEALKDAPNMAGISVWCQTGGWHRFKRLAFLEADRDVWIRLNVACAIGVFKNGSKAEDALTDFANANGLKAAPLIELLKLAEAAINELLYVGAYASQSWYFRRVRIPPMLHLYWDSVFVNDGVRKIVSHFVADREEALKAAQSAADGFPRMIELAEQAGLPSDDLRHMSDLFGILLLVREYYFRPFTDDIANRIRAAKKDYKQRWPKARRYRIKVSFERFPLDRKTIAVAVALLVRDRSKYRWLDRLVTLRLMGFAYRMLLKLAPGFLPPFMRQSAMGVEVLFK